MALEANDFSYIRYSDIYLENLGGIIMENSKKDFSFEGSEHTPMMHVGP